MALCRERRISGAVGTLTVKESSGMDAKDVYYGACMVSHRIIEKLCPGAGVGYLDWSDGPLPYRLVRLISPAWRVHYLKQPHTIKLAAGAFLSPNMCTGKRAVQWQRRRALLST
jgi:hypothetical protein